MDWIVFGDDWGAHVSTTQHLVLNLPPEDRVVWVDSIGMRQPRLRLADLRRLAGKAQRLARRADHRAPADHYRGSVADVSVIRPLVLPFHFDPLAHRFNGVSLARAITARLRALAISDAVLLSVNPVLIRYADQIPHRRLAYLRLDDYAAFPGVDPELVRRSEPQMFERAQAIFATARGLLPGGAAARKAHYLPQGVLFEHFASIALEPRPNRTLGFYGLISEYIDFELVERVAMALPDWQLEFHGERKRERIPERIGALHNVSFHPRVPFAELPRLLAGWTAAWAPYVLDEHTRKSNPLKVREYLAAGLPAHCTPIPEAAQLSQLKISSDADAIVRWLRDQLEHDTPAARSGRRESVRDESWAARSRMLRAVMADA